MRENTAKQRIKKAVNKRLTKEPEPVKKYIEELILLTWQANRLDTYSYKNDTEALEDAIEINLDYELNEVLKEAREETAKDKEKRA